MTKKISTEGAYLIRCWHEHNVSPDASPAWCLSIEDVLGERHQRGFDDVESLIAFLLSEFTEDEEPAGQQ